MFLGTNYLHILQEINRPELEFGQIEDIIKKEVSLFGLFFRQQPSYLNDIGCNVRCHGMTSYSRTNWLPVYYAGKITPFVAIKEDISDLPK